jgi:hypothetical protein
MQQTPVPVPKVVIPPHLRTVNTPAVTVPKPILVPKPTVVPQPTVTVPKPVVVPTPTVAKPIVVPQPQPMQTLVVQPQAQAKPAMQTQPTATGGILRQFGGGTVTIATPQPTAAPTITIVEETGYSILVKLLDIWGGNTTQAQQLANLRYADGSSIIDVKRRDIIREIIGMLGNQSFDYVIDFLTAAPNPEFILWDQDSLDEGRTKVAREIAIQQAEEVGVKGVGRCRYCPSTELVFAMKQLRSGDEPASVFVRCVMCNKQWRQQ